MKREKNEAWIVWLSFLMSIGTLLCCTLPMVFIALGLGATLAALAYHFELLTTFTEYKFWIFLTSGLLLLFTTWLLKRPGRSCPTDPILAKKCLQLTTWNYRIFWLSVTLWIIGFVSAYLAVPITIWIGQK